MATFGYATGPTFGFVKDNSKNIAASFVGGMPSPGGYVTAIHVFAGTFSGVGAAGYLCLWDGSGNLLTFQGGVTVPGTPGWINFTLPTSFYVASGQGLFIGVQLNPVNGGLNVDYDSNASFLWDFGANGTTYPGSIGTHTQFTSQAMGAYVDYTPLTAPTISGVTPNPAVPGQQITVTGTGFLQASGVKVGGVSCTSLVISSDTSLTCFLASSTPGGTQGVVVTNPAGSNSAFNIVVGGIAHINTGTPASPVWTQGIIFVNTGTPASPVWTAAAPVEVWSGTAWVVAS